MPQEPSRECRLHWQLNVRPGDLNPQLNLFGGRVMELVNNIAAEAAGQFAAMPVVTAAFDSMDFKAPLQAYDRILLTARGTRTFNTSMEVRVKVEGFDPSSGRRWHTGTGMLTLVALGPDNRPTTFPPIEPATAEQQTWWKTAEKRRKLRLNRPTEPDPNFSGHHEGNSSHLCFESMTDAVLPVETNELGMIKAGHVLSIADKLAGISAGRHSHHGTVTAAVDYVHFLQPILVGELLDVRSYLTRAFNSSMEVRVEVWKREQPWKDPVRVTTAYFTMVAMDHDQPVSVPELQLKSEVDLRLYEAAGERRRLSRQIDEESEQDVDL